MTMREILLEVCLSFLIAIPFSMLIISNIISNHNRQEQDK